MTHTLTRHLMLNSMKKGDSVIIISNWDGKGVFAWKCYTVKSAGKKQAHLVCANGKNMEERIFMRCNDAFTGHDPELHRADIEAKFKAPVTFRSKDEIIKEKYPILWNQENA